MKDSPRTRGSTGSTAAHDTPTAVDVGNFYLAPGAHAIAVYYYGVGMGYTNGSGANQKYSNKDIDLSLGEARTQLFGGSTYTPRVWNGTVHYITAGWPHYGVYGKGCAGSNGTPMLAPGSAFPVVGKTFQVNLTKMPTGGGGVLVLNGFGKDKLLGSVPLPFDLTFAGAPGCSLLTDIVFTLSAGNTGGTGLFKLAIPNDPNLLGGHVTSQAAVIDAGANPLGVTFTNGGEMHIGR